MGHGATAEPVLEGSVPIPPATACRALMNPPYMTAYISGSWCYCLWFCTGFLLTWLLLAKGKCLLAILVMLIRIQILLILHQ